MNDAEKIAQLEEQIALLKHDYEELHRQKNAMEVELHGVFRQFKDALGIIDYDD